MIDPARFFPILDWGRRYNRQTLASDDVSTRLLNTGSVPVKSSPEMFAKQISADFGQWKRVIAGR